MKSNYLGGIAMAVFAAGLLAPAGDTEAAGIRITEWMYNPTAGEFVELTNLGPTAIDLTGWKYSDDARIPSFDLSAFGLVASGQTVLLTELSAEDFRAEWSVPESVLIIGNLTPNLGRNDEINIYDADDNLVDRLSYGDQTFPGTIRTAGISGVPGSDAAIGINDVSQWILSFVGDDQGSYASLSGLIGSPGFSTATVVPVPPAAVLLLSAFGVLGALRRRKALAA